MDSLRHGLSKNIEIVRPLVGMVQKKFPRAELCSEGNSLCIIRLSDKPSTTQRDRSTIPESLSLSAGGRWNFCTKKGSKNGSSLHCDAGRSRDSGVWNNGAITVLRLGSVSLQLLHSRATCRFRKLGAVYCRLCLECV